MWGLPLGKSSLLFSFSPLFWSLALRGCFLFELCVLLWLVLPNVGGVGYMVAWDLNKHGLDFAVPVIASPGARALFCHVF